MIAAGVDPAAVGWGVVHRPLAGGGPCGGPGGGLLVAHQPDHVTSAPCGASAVAPGAGEQRNPLRIPGVDPRHLAHQ